MAQKRFYKELRTLAKRANQRMVELEKRGMRTGAYDAVQGFLEMAGHKTKRATGRRFSETGKATYNEAQLYMKFLNRFLNAKTSTVTGTKKFYNDVWKSADENMNLSGMGITQNEYMEIWENLPQKKRDRLYGSDTIIRMVSTALRKGNGTATEGERVTVAEIVAEIQSSKNVKDSYNRLGITYKDMAKTKSLGKL